MKMGANLPTYRAFALEELKEATNNFSHPSIIAEPSLTQVWIFLFFSIFKKS